MPQPEKEIQLLRRRRKRFRRVDADSRDVETESDVSAEARQRRNLGRSEARRSGRRADQPTAARVREHDVRDISVLAVIVPGPVGPATREVEAEVAAIL